MTKAIMSPQQVRQAREMAQGGQRPKDIAQKMDLSYPITWNAIHGISHADLEPPPLPVGYPRHYICKNCGDKYPTGRCRDLCQACYTYQYRHGRPRNPDDPNFGKHILLNVDRLAQLYNAGISVYRIAAALDISEETIYRRLREHPHVKVRSRHATKRKLTPALVRQIRQMVNADGIPKATVARQLDINYSTLSSAANGDTWRHAGGPLPAGAKPTKQAAEKCAICTILTEHHSGICYWCRQEDNT